MKIFVDTGALYALVVPPEPNHTKANNWFNENRYPLVMTDYIFDELLTLLTARKNKSYAIAVHEELSDGRIPVDIYKIDVNDFAKARVIFNSFRDKDWSFTDCTSYVVMKRLDISSAFTFDPHFDQFGFLTRVP